MPTNLTKLQFIENAPVYYALAISLFFIRANDVAYEEDIKQLFTERMFDGDTYEYLQKTAVFIKAMEWLTARNIVEPLPDMFGPTIFKKGALFDEQREKLANSRGTPFFTYASISSQEKWLHTALINLNEAFDELKIEDADFAETPDTQWAPIPLDRSDETLKTAISALDNLISEIRADNGYSVTIPEERDFVLEAMTRASDKLKSAAHISAPYIRSYVLEPIAIISNRFKDAAISISATAAREAIIEWLKQNAGRILHYLLSGF